jgi:hypothetical protein
VAGSDIDVTLAQAMAPQTAASNSAIMIVTVRRVIRSLYGGGWMPVSSPVNK